MYLWRKFAAPRWWQDREELLQTRAHGALTVIEWPGRARVQLEACFLDHRSAKDLLAEFGGEIERLPRNWLERFSREQNAEPLKIGRRLIILNVGGTFASRKSQSKARHLIIPAAAAFGTGQHATTAMCLRLLEEATRGWKDHWHMLDAGTGTGILALAGRCSAHKMSSLSTTIRMRFSLPAKTLARMPSKVCDSCSEMRSGKSAEENSMSLRQISSASCWFPRCHSGKRDCSGMAS